MAQLNNRVDILQYSVLVVGIENDHFNQTCANMIEIYGAVLPIMAPAMRMTGRVFIVC